MSYPIAKDLLLAQYINTKINHDLINICGPLNNAIESLNDTNTSKKIREQSEELIKSCAIEMTSRLKMFREIYGVSYDQNDQANLKKIKDLVKELIGKNTAKIILDWRLDDTYPSVSDEISKIILVLANLCIKKLINGGSLIISTPEDSEMFKVVISAMGKNIVCNDSQNNLINTNMEVEPSINTIEIVYIKYLAKLFNFVINVEQEDNTIKYNILKVKA